MYIFRSITALVFLFLTTWTSADTQKPNQYLPPQEQFKADQLRAKEGDPEAIYQVAQGFIDGRAGEADFLQAAEHLKIAASMNYYPALRKLAEYHDKGLTGEYMMVIEYSPERAAKYEQLYVARVHELAEEGTDDYRVYKIAGYNYHFGRFGKEENLLKARKAYDQMLAQLEVDAGNGDVLAMITLYKIYNGGGALVVKNPEVAQAWLQKAVATGHPGAIYAQGSLMPDGTAKIARMKESLEAGFPGAAVKLAEAYSGLGEYNRSLQFNLKAYEFTVGSPAQMIRVSESFEKAGNFDEAVQWRLNAAPGLMPRPAYDNLFQLYVLILDKYMDGIGDEYGYGSLEYKKSKNEWLSSRHYVKFSEAHRNALDKCEWAEGEYQSKICKALKSNDFPAPLPN